MAKVYYSPLINVVRGKVGDTIYSTSGPIPYIKRANPSVSQPRTFRQMQIRLNLCYFSKKWDSLPESYQDLWCRRATISNSMIFGKQMFIRHNCNLLNASHSDLTEILYPPFKPGTPVFPKNFTVFPVSSNLFCLSWTSPHLVSLYITAFYRLHKGFCLVHPNFGLCPTFGYRPYFRFIETVRSDVNHILFFSPWPNNTRLFFKIRSTDKFGRVSPFTAAVKILQV